MPGLIECHSHPLFAGSRHAEYARRLGGASLDRPPVRDERVGRGVGGLQHGGGDPEDREQDEPDRGDAEDAGGREAGEGDENPPHDEHPGEHRGPAVPRTEGSDRDRAQVACDGDPGRHHADCGVVDVEGVLQDLRRLRVGQAHAALQPVGEAQRDHGQRTGPRSHGESDRRPAL